MNAGPVNVDQANTTIDDQIAAGHEESQVCTGCWQRLPAHCFRRRSKVTGERHVRCQLCFNKERRILRAKKRAARIGEFARYVNVHRNSVARIEAAYVEIVRVFGGFQPFARYWREAILQATKDRRHGLVSRHFMAITNLGIVSAQASVEQPSVELLSDEELSRNIDENLKAIIAQNPELAIRAAKKLGWQVIPPEQEVGGSEVDDLKAEAFGADDV